MGLCCSCCGDDGGGVTVVDNVINDDGGGWAPPPDGGQVNNNQMEMMRWHDTRTQWVINNSDEWLILIIGLINVFGNTYKVYGLILYLATRLSKTTEDRASFIIVIHKSCHI